MRDEDNIAQSPSHASRQVLFRNEAFVIGALITVSLVVAFALVGQGPALVASTGSGALMVALTVVFASLACSVVASLFRHIKWLVKATVVGDQVKRQRRLKLGKWYRRWTRRLMLSATILLILSLVALVVGTWARFISP